jgi:integrase
VSKGSRRPHGDGSVYYLPGKDLWAVAVDLGWKGGKRDRRYFYARDQAGALAKRDLFLDRRRAGFTLPKGRAPTVADWCLYWLHEIVRDEVEATTWHRSYRQKTEDHIAPWFAKTRLSNEDFDEAAVRAFKRHLLAKPRQRGGGRLSATTVQHVMRLLSEAAKAAVTEGRLIRNPVANVSAPARSTAEPVPPPEDEVLAILRQCGDWRTGPRWVTAIATGLRQGEALGMLWPCADLDGGQLAVEWELVRLPWQHGCSGDPGGAAPCGLTARRCPMRHSGGLRLKRPKSARSRRVVPLAPFAVAALRQWRTDQKAERLAHPAWEGWAHGCGRRLRRGDLVCPACMAPARPDLLVFTQPSGHPVDARRDWQDWQDILAAAGAADRYGTHANRHGLATALLEDGMEIRYVQEIMGHSAPDFTRRAYAHVRQKPRDAARDAIEARLTRRVQP